MTPARVLYDYDEAAAMLKTSTRTLRRWVQRKEIGHVRHGRQVRFRQADLEKFAERNAVRPRR